MIDFLIDWLIDGEVLLSDITSSRMRTAGAAMLPILAMVETRPIPVCLLICHSHHMVTQANKQGKISSERPIDAIGVHIKFGSGRVHCISSSWAFNKWTSLFLLMLWQHRELVQNTIGKWGPELQVNSYLVMTKWWFSLTQNPNAPDLSAVTANDMLVTQPLSAHYSTLAKAITALLLHAYLRQWTVHLQVF